MSFTPRWNSQTLLVCLQNPLLTGGGGDSEFHVQEKYWSFSPSEE